MSKTTLSRRDFLKTTAAVGGGLVIGLYLPGASRVAEAAARTHAAAGAMPNAWVRITPDNEITIMCARAEMGQGVYTTMPMLVAEELEVDFNKIKVEIAEPRPEYVNSILHMQATGGSTSTVEGYDKLRQAGAVARTMLVQAAAKHWKVPETSCRAENGHVVSASGKKLTYGQLAAAAAQLPQPKDVQLKPADQFKIVGKPTRRKDSPFKVNGTARFGIDVVLPNMLHASIAQCPVLHGKVKSFNDARARAMPGVRQIVALDDGVAVLADHYWQAKTAREALDIVWDEGPNAHLSSADVSAKLAEEAKRQGDKVRHEGDADAALAGAAKKLEATYELPYLAHATMEPMNFTADVRADGVDVYGPTQAPGGAQGFLCHILGLKPEQVRVHSTFLGGGFGRRFEMDFVKQAVLLSKAAGRPVKVIWTREDDVQHDYYRPVARDTLRAGLDAGNRIVAWNAHLASPSISKRVFPAQIKALGYDRLSVEGAENWPYNVPNVKIDHVIADINVDVGFWRSVSNSLNVFVSESFVDELAHAAGEDPVAFRRKHLDKMPRLQKALDVAAEQAGWGKAPAGRFQGVALMEGYGSHVVVIPEISVNADHEIRVHKVTVAVDCGQNVNPDTVQAQVQSAAVFGLSAALFGEITLKDGRVQQSNFHDYRVVRMNESPAFNVHIIPSTAHPGGMGEPVTATIMPALANAVFAATGKRLRALPLTKEAIQKA